jgi:hypothetical protein
MSSRIPLHAFIPAYDEIRYNIPMSDPAPHNNTPTPDSEQAWFRSPTPREHRIAAALFMGFGLFFVLLFFVEPGWPFRWVILALGLFSIFHGLRHLADALRASRQ